MSTIPEFHSTIRPTVALAVWAFYVSLAGRKLFKDSLLDGA